MSIEMDAGAGRPRAFSNATNVDAEIEAAEPDPAEGWLMILTTLAGVLAASSLGVWVFLR
ncbi:hypothetical protein [Rhodoplanes sp. Z2-YC6860]|uniref:hypothetical protein n=1 Tax=Rhodoplanes sp. Z2-YC6860 TaxID=674703 RepID=UPI0012ED9721|nr:hypothetical protein [Rhodoplanes sp. Z2-YC6860]